MQAFLGTGTALITPFNEDKSVDVVALEQLVEFQIANGVEYIVVLGTTAESVTLTSEEKELVKKTIIEKTNGRVPLVLGVGGNNTATVVSDLKTLDLSKFDAVLSVSPYYNKPSQEGIFQHYVAVADASPVPVIIYNVPGRTSSNIEPATVSRLAETCKNIIGVKEAAGDMVQAMKLIQTVPNDFLVISGDDMIALPMTLAGGAGVISVLGQAYPKEFSDMIRLGLEKSSEAAFQIQYQMMDVVDLIFEEGNPVGIKALLSVLEDVETSMEVRLPLVAATESLQEKLKQFAHAFA
ncbi:4-hydroxy-tetrahydrodipicolinate synthase [Flavicella sp.]|uniref:4-hydroxy-tetrahydrodipicolinate synthase n=1 Tax=Flavicella sp. TaxID=2957742 RepID=UPI00262A07DD|nr:4-hydroxy-tetrahydrodipicolinate synthase [Flavicella sp.]MDG1805744.1 4-hydroxy-tetrahydrodipicolinate synthase [Flavicella sp.]MDG2279197.1 4-hydroxy-tetrahydrodipicolinate synthase [Flavicella sp.]